MSFQSIASHTNWQNNRKIAKNRLVSIDLLRGLVMVLMTLYVIGSIDISQSINIGG
jgi:uncharacterized membrane protein